jgi:hypothetical protein
MDRKGEVYACMQAYRSALAQNRDDLAIKCIERARAVSRSIGDGHLQGLVEMERLIISNRTPDRKDIEEMKELLEGVGRDEGTFFIKGILKMARKLDDPSDGEKKELRGICLGMAMEELREGSSHNGQLIARDHDLSSQERQELMVDLLEQALSLDGGLSLKERRRLEKIASFPYVKVKVGNQRTSLLEGLVDAYQELSDTILGGVRETGGDPSKFDDAVEGLLHTSILLGRHHMQEKSRKRARETFRRCRRFIERYEKDLKRIPDHVPTFDLRKVKEVLEENRSMLEGERF